jgi:hypothetical protein
MYCRDSTLASHLQNSGGVEITLAGCGSADTISFITDFDMQRLLIGARINRNAGDAQLAGGAGYAYRNFTSIGDQNLAEHYLTLNERHSWLTGW